MPQSITSSAKSALDQIQKTPNVVFNIEGVDLIFSSAPILIPLTWDNEEGITWDNDEGVTWDGLVQSANNRTFIDLAKSTKNITQQIYPDKEGSGSISGYTAVLVDKDGEVARTLALNTITEILGKKCDVSLGFDSTSYPADYLDIFRGVITDFWYDAGAIYLTCQHPDTLKKQTILKSFQDNLDGAIDASTTTITVNSTSGYFESQDILTSYIKIDDEIMLVSGTTSTTFTVTRAQLGSVADMHDDDAEVTSIYQLEENPLDMALKIMLSDDSNSYFDSDIVLKNFEYVDALTTIENAMIFEVEDIQRETGLVAGDTVQVDTYGDFTVSNFGKLDDGNSYIIVEETLSTVTDVGQNWRFRSKYNVLNFGLGMFPFQVDVAEFESVLEFFGANFTDLRFRIEEDIDDPKKFIDKELLFVSGCYSVPRNAKSSVRFLSPPIAIDAVPTLNTTNVLNMSKVYPRRSIHNYYYNDILYKYGKSILDGNFKVLNRTINLDSVNTFNLGVKQLSIESDGLKNDGTGTLISSRLATRFLDRYQNAATYLKDVKLPFKTGYNLEVSDVVLFGGEDTQLLNFDTGARDFPLEKYEIINKKVSITEGVVSLDLLSTGYGNDIDYASISPASLLDTGSTTTKLFIKPIGNPTQPATERARWESFIGAKVNVRSADFTFSEETTITGLDPQTQNGLIVSPALSTAPSADYVLEFADYESHTSSEVTDDLKLRYVFNMRQATINSVTSTTVFDVDDATSLYDGQTIAIHSPDFVRGYEDKVIDTVVGTTVTLTTALSYTPQVNDVVDHFMFQDTGRGYGFL